jgi:NADPH2:quinone reductase
MLPDTMTAITITRAGGPEVLQPGTRPVPEPGSGQVLIKVAYAGSIVTTADSVSADSVRPARPTFPDSK